MGRLRPVCGSIKVAVRTHARVRLAPGRQRAKKPSVPTGAFAGDLSPNADNV